MKNIVSIILVILSFASITYANQSHTPVLHKGLCIVNGVVDTVVVVDSSTNHYTLRLLSSDKPSFRLKKKEFFEIPFFKEESPWVKVRYEDDFLVDDIFVLAKVLGCNEQYLLIRFDTEQTQKTTSIHKSQVAVKDLKRLGLN